ncbi:glycosyltransferase [Winogradskyella aurantia]|uniref:glycosyltransferase n=1 Tax=Winogradskyella aurantia TaxID=1915063 RepID=UPI001F0B3E7A|nr:glycosyltransferase [Winogradskyella aurantia]
MKAIELPSYNITYPKKANHFKLKFLKDAPHILSTIKKEKELVATITRSEQLVGIISDNRFGVRHHSVPSVFITHQLRVMSGSTTWLSSKLHQRIISKFDECWVPDIKGQPNLSGRLGHVDNFKIKPKYIGPLSRFVRKDVALRYDVLILLSGPEPQRTILEEKLLIEFDKFNGTVCFVRGKIESEEVINYKGHITIHNFLKSADLERIINASAVVLSRSGYTTIMDLAKLQKKAFFIPTPGQFEQEYLSEKLMSANLVPSCKQERFSIDHLSLINDFKGLGHIRFQSDFSRLFDLFQGKGELTAHT